MRSPVLKAVVAASRTSSSSSSMVRRRRSSAFTTLLGTTFRGSLRSPGAVESSSSPPLSSSSDLRFRPFPSVDATASSTTRRCGFGFATIRGVLLDDDRSLLLRRRYFATLESSPPPSSTSSFDDDDGSTALPTASAEDDESTASEGTEKPEEEDGPFDEDRRGATSPSSPSKASDLAASRHRGHRSRDRRPRAGGGERRRRPRVDPRDDDRRRARFDAPRYGEKPPPAQDRWATQEGRPNRPQQHRERGGSPSPRERWATQKGGQRPLFHDDKSPERPRHRRPRKNVVHPQQQRRHRSKINIVHWLSPVRSIATSDWVKITNVPVMTSLDDVLRGIDRALSIESERGIVDLDEVERRLESEGKNGNDGRNTAKEGGGDEGLPLWTPPTSSGDGEPSLPSHLVLSAHLLLSRRYRPSGYALRFPNRSVVQALLSHASDPNERPVTCGPRPMTLEEYIPPPNPPPPPSDSPDDIDDDDARRFFESSRLDLDDSVLRVENCSLKTRPEDLLAFFRQYDLADFRSLPEGRDVVELLVKGGEQEEISQTKRGGEGRRREPLAALMTHAFLVRFDDPSDARAAVRDLQLSTLLGRKVRLAPYPQQIL